MTDFRIGRVISLSGGSQSAYRPAAMFKTRYPVPGTAPATLLPLPKDCTTGTTLKLVEYNEHEITEREISRIEDLPDPFLDDGKARWIDMEGLGDGRMLKALGEKYHLHPLALEDVVNIGQRPKVEPYDKHLFIVADMVYADKEDGRLCGEQVSMFLGKYLLITIQEALGGDVFDPVRERLRSGRGNIRKSAADYLGYALLDATIDHYFPVLEDLGSSIEDLEDDVLERPAKNTVSRIQHTKRTLMQLRRYVWPMRDVVTALIHDDTGLITDNTKVFLRDCYDHSIQIMDLVETYRDVVSGLMDLYLSAVGMRTNEIMRVLTVMSAIFIPLTFVAGVYGMNFDRQDGWWNMPELHQPWGYPACMALMAAIALGQIIFFKRKKWL